MTSPGRKRKLIEVALPLDEINAACKADKGRAHGTLKNLHKWFAPMPVPAWRALLFAALVDDPGDEVRRAVLLSLIKRLVANGADLPDEDAIEEARALIRAQFPGGPPIVHDPFCGGGSTLVEAQRLGLETFGSDLNPVPVLISRTLTEILPRVANRQPLHSPSPLVSASNVLMDLRDTIADGRLPGLDGLTVDVSHYASRIRDAALARLAEWFPPASKSTVAWLWARTAQCPNPVCGVETVLTTTWWLSKRKKDLAWIEPTVVDGAVHLEVVVGRRTSGDAPEAPKSPRGAYFRCLGCNNTIDEETLTELGAGRGLGLRLTAVVTEDRNGRRSYRAPTEEEIVCADVPIDEFDLPDNVPVGDGGSRNRFGLTHQASLYTPRQLAVLATLSDLVAKTFQDVLDDGGTTEWATAIATILGLGVGRFAQFGSSQARWTVRSNVSSFEGAFPRNDLPMTWDFYEINPFGTAGPSWTQTFVSITRSFRNVVSGGHGRVVLGDARHTVADRPALVATDPPYFDAIGYADLSDYFYVWHRRALKSVHPDLYGTVAAPKQGELTALAPHHGNDRRVAREYFISGFTAAFRSLQSSLTPEVPMIVVYASREQGPGDEQSRWASILTAMVNADMQITGAWPILGTTDRRMIGQGTNVVATYVAMTCRPRPADAQATTLTDFNRALRRELSVGVRELQASSILPIDLAQAAMGPGMQIYSRYRAVLDQSGTPIAVDHALRLINAALGEVLEEQEGELDPSSRLAVRWWEMHGWSPAPYGDADQLARPLGIGVDEVVRSRVATSSGGKVRLLGSEDLDPRWTPETDQYPTAWEAVHHLANRLIDRGGELEAARLMASLGSLHDPAMALVYRLHDIAAKKGQSADQERYNALINSWSELVKLSKDVAPTLEGLF